MYTSYRIPIQFLGQSGLKFSMSDLTIYVDPYLSESVRDLENKQYQRQVAIPVDPSDVTDADWVFITHDHLDHCDPHTLPQLAKASPEASFVGPAPVLNTLKSWGIDETRLKLAEEGWVNLSEALKFRAVAAAHPEIERDEGGNLACIGFLFAVSDRKFYVSGDTSVKQEIIDDLKKEAPIHTAILPVNERNFFRDRLGIIGNMSVREAFQFASEIGVKQVIPVHWDMFEVNSVSIGEIRAIYNALKLDFSLLIQPQVLNLSEAQISLVIRTLNEARHLEELLISVSQQDTQTLDHEVVLVDSGSTDGTLEIAERYGCKILHITREEFTFGRSLNVGCEIATGDALVFISGHCVPCDDNWLYNLTKPIFDGEAGYTYGRQFGGPETFYSEKRIFAKYFPETTQIPQAGFFCNNANSALAKSDWEKYRFDEELTGLEDMELAKRLVEDGGNVAYVADAGIFHYHYENWHQVKRRFEREAIALQQIMPHIQMRYSDLIRYIISSIFKDLRKSREEGMFFKNLLGVLGYRYFQYTGSFKGNRDHRKLSHREREKYFFPQ